MKRIHVVLLSLILIFMSGCSKEVNKFDTLDNSIKALLMHGSIDDRVSEYRDLDLMSFTFFTDEDGTYTYLTSEVGSGHPLLHFTETQKDIIFECGLVNTGRSGIREFQEDLEIKEFSKDSLYEAYLEFQEAYDQAALKIKEEESLKERFSEISKEGGFLPLNGVTLLNSDLKVPSPQEIRKLYIEDVIPVMFTSEQVTMMRDYNKQSYDAIGLVLNEDGTPRLTISPAGNETIISFEDNNMIFDFYRIGGVSMDGEVERIYEVSASYNLETREILRIEK